MPDNTKYLYTDFISGNDTTGNGDFATPYKTVAKAHSMMTATRYAIAMLTDETVTTTITLNYSDITNTRIKMIQGVNATTGLPDGTQRTLSGGGTLDYMFSAGGSSYPWRFSNLHITNLTEYVFKFYSNYLYYPIFDNYKVSYCKGQLNTTLGIQYPRYFDVTFENCSGGTVLYIRGGSIDGILFKDCDVQINSAVLNVVLAAIVRNLIIKSCTSGYGVVYTVSNTIIEDFILDDIEAGYLSYAECFYIGSSNAILRNGIIQNCYVSDGTGTIRKNIIFVNSGSSDINGLILYNNTGFDNNTALNSNSSLIERDFNVVTTEPLDANLNPLPTYPYRRYQQKLGEYNGNLTEESA